MSEFDSEFVDLLLSTCDFNFDLSFASPDAPVEQMESVAEAITSSYELSSMHSDDVTRVRSDACESARKKQRCCSSEDGEDSVNMTYALSTRGKATIVSNSHGKRVYQVTAFPSFGQTDFLHSIPVLLAQMVNSGDFGSLRDLLHRRAEQDCVTLFSCSEVQRLGHDNIVRYYEAIQEYYPDMFLFVTSISVLENAVAATVCYRGTNMASIRRSLQNSSAAQFYNNSAECLKMTLQPDDVEKWQQYVDIIDSDGDMILDGKAEMNINFDPSTKKIVRFELRCHPTKVQRLC